MGTPMLKNGIKCTGVPPDDDTLSDICTGEVDEQQQQIVN